MFRASVNCSVHGPKKQEGRVVLDRVGYPYKIKNDGLWLFTSSSGLHFNHLTADDKREIIRQLWRNE
jgi:hypothetical protein